MSKKIGVKLRWHACMLRFVNIEMLEDLYVKRLG
jgi:hypothetical protein